MDLEELDRHAAAAARAVLDGSPELLGTTYRHVAKQSTHRALLADSHPLARALAAHVARFTVLRLVTQAAREVEAARARPAAPVGGLRRSVAGATADPRASVDAALLEAMAAPDVALVRAWLAVGESAAPVAARAARVMCELGAEAERRLDVIRIGPLQALASSFLSATLDLARASMRPFEPAGVLLASVARHAGDGWPRRPVARFVVDAFGADARARRTLVRLLDRARVAVGPTRPFGASSHARLVRDAVFAIHARTPGEGPFAPRHDPDWTEANVSALLVTSALSIPSFHARVLRCGARSSRAQARALAVTGLAMARADAARLLPPDPARSELLFGQPLGPALSMLVPRALPDERGRFGAWLALPAELARVVHLHDEDWFRNPRFWDEMAIRFASPCPPADLGRDTGSAHPEQVVDRGDAVGALVSAFASRLG